MVGETTDDDPTARRVVLTDGGESEAPDDEGDESEGSEADEGEGEAEQEGEEAEETESDEADEQEDEDEEGQEEGEEEKEEEEQEDGEEGENEEEQEEGEDEEESEDEEDEGATVLYLDIGDGLFLNLLGLEVDLAEVELDVSAVPGDNRLVGNLLNAVAGLLDKPSLPDFGDMFGGLGGVGEKISSSLRNAGSAIMEELDLGQLLRDILSGFVDELTGSSDNGGSEGGDSNGDDSEGGDSDNGDSNGDEGNGDSEE